MSKGSPGTHCTALTCYGVEIPGTPLRCPRCNGTLLIYPATRPAVARRQAA